MIGTEKILYFAKYCLLAVLWCDSPESHNHLSERRKLFTLTAEKPNLCYRPLTMRPCLMSTLIYYCQVQFPTFFFRWPNLSQWKQVQYCLLYLV